MGPEVLDKRTARSFCSVVCRAGLLGQHVASLAGRWWRRYLHYAARPAFFSTKNIQGREICHFVLSGLGVKGAGDGVGIGVCANGMEA